MADCIVTIVDSDGRPLTHCCLDCKYCKGNIIDNDNKDIGAFCDNYERLMKTKSNFVSLKDQYKPKKCPYWGKNKEYYRQRADLFEGEGKE